MIRYLQRAFLATVRLPIVGRVPFNLVFIAAVIGLGMVREWRPIWVFGAALEMVYLYALSFNPRFQKAVDAEYLAAEQRDPQLQRRRLIDQLNKPAREKLLKLESKSARALDIAARNGAEPFMLQSQRDGLDRLSWLYLKLLLGRQMLDLQDHSADPQQLQWQIAHLDRELADGQLVGTVRESKAETRRILERRLELQSRRSAATAEIDADLSRIEAEVDLAVENASLGPQASGISGSVKLATTMLESDLFGASRSDVAALDATYDTAKPGGQTE